jgi:hypothetical protein
MKRVITILIIILPVVEGCGRNNQSDNESDAFITVNVRASYPKKELILQHFMDVEYIALETSDKFLCQGRVLDIGRDVILVRNDAQDGNIFVFDGKGKGIRKINRRGNGDEEYIIIFGIALDEDNGEMFVNDVIAKKVAVYDLYGNFKRSFRYNEGIRIDNIYNFDRENLICIVGVDTETPDKSTFIIISKRDGSIVNEIQIPYKQKKSTKIDGNGNFFMIYPYYPVLPFHDSWILSEASSDTVFRFSPDNRMIPFMTRVPSVQSMNPEVFLFPKILTDRYYFMEKVKKEKNFPKTDLMYDRQKKALYEYSLYNDDYSNKQRVNMAASETKNGEIAFWQKIESYELVESYKKGELKGKLKDVAAGLDEESNPVIMLVKNKQSM